MERNVKVFFAGLKKRRIFATDFRTTPHSSSGPGHLPLTQKIISSTLICGTKKNLK